MLPKTPTWVVTAFPYLTELSISHCASVADDDLRALGLQGSGLRKLAVAGCLSITSLGITAIARGCGRDLRELDISDCEGVDGKGARAVLLRCRRLTKFVVDGCVRAATDGAIVGALDNAGAPENNNEWPTTSEEEAAAAARHQHSTLEWLSLRDCYKVGYPGWSLPV